ncbi:hypothetical protein AOL_s00210g126 [Orbilia oligospora ATCC 24927]|uniref:Uncharacterized protein n=1 Tax=Arthrobotrys oligospora (strain ATCC 24927 / CBS 115.81 / DSM 1491) TaxID=756982 RepID=G1XRW8_ARTOA|nr:hypothetical protein AOL_s00210g126 [Orbilia oligospora ATCC 24927]EGX44145.1 hypothetical protein AOL_s00210g126 [Orbilia oligospora ATCC 24927]
MLFPLLLLLTNTPQTTAYYTVFLREIGPEWFMSFNYFLTGTNLHPRSPSPTSCHEVTISHHRDPITALGIYNPPEELPISALAVFPYKTPQCGKLTPSGAAINIKGPPTFIVVLSPEELYGLSVIDVERLGIEWYRGAIQPLNLTAERVDPRGLLYGLPDYGGSGVYIWEGGGEEGSYQVPEWRTWVPGVVEKIVEPRRFLEDVDVRHDRMGYIYIRDLMERYLRPDMRELKDNITPWIQGSVDKKMKKKKKKEEDGGSGGDEDGGDDENDGNGEKTDVRIKGKGKGYPSLRGPLYGEKDKTSWLIKGNWYTKEDNTPLRRSNEEARRQGRKKARQPETEEKKRGWTLAYKGPKPGSIPGMEYYDLQEPIRLDVDSSLEDINIIEEEEGGLGDGTVVDGDDDRYQTILSSADLPQPRHRMEGFQDGSQIEIELEEGGGDWDEEVDDYNANNEWEEGYSNSQELQSGSILEPVPKNYSPNEQQQDLRNLLQESDIRQAATEELKQEEAAEEEAVAEELDTSSNLVNILNNNNNNINNNNVNVAANVINEQLQALTRLQNPNINDPEVALRAQELQMLSQSEMLGNINPFWYSSTLRDRDRNNININRMPGINIEDRMEGRASTTSNRWRNPADRDISQTGGQRLQLSRSLEDYQDYEDYEEPQGRNTRPRGRNTP